MRTKERLILSVIAKHEGQQREALRFFVTPETTVGDIMSLENVLNKMAAPVEFEIKSEWERVPA